MSDWRVGLVGGGHWARTVHVPALAGHPRARLAAVWTRTPEQAVEVAAASGATAVPRFDDLLDEVDAVVFAVPPDVQADLAARAAAAGRHLVCEKPIAASLVAAERLAAAALPVLSSVVLTFRHDPGVRSWLAGLPPAPASGSTVASARWLSGALLGGPYAASSWRVARGALLDLGPHVVDLLEAAVGPVATVEWARRDDPDLWRFGLLHSGGAQSTTTMSLRLPVDPSEIEFTVFGSAGRHRFASRPADSVGCVRALWDELLAALDGTGPPPASDLARGLTLQRVLDEIERVATR